MRPDPTISQSIDPCKSLSAPPDAGGLLFTSNSPGNVPGSQPGLAPGYLPPSILDSAVNYMESRLARFGLMLYKLQGPELSRFPGRVRGNRQYAYAMRRRVDDIQRAISDKLLIDKQAKRSNVAFITLTVPSPRPEWSFCRVAEYWKQVSTLRSRFFVNMAKNGVSSYVYAVESNGSAGIHFHSCMILDKPEQWHQDKSGVWRSDRLRDLVRWYWGKIEWRELEPGRKERVSIPHGYIDVIGSYSDGVAGYITKELFKLTSVEESVRLYRASKIDFDTKEGKNHIKRILAFSLAGKAGIRQFGVSRDIPWQDVEDDSELANLEEVARLDDKMNNPSDSQDGEPFEFLRESEIVRVYTQILSRNQLWKLLGGPPPPYTGTVDPGSHEYQVIYSLFQNHKNADTNSIY